MTAALGVLSLGSPACIAGSGKPRIVSAFSGDQEGPRSFSAISREIAAQSEELRNLYIQAQGLYPYLTNSYRVRLYIDDDGDIYNVDLLDRDQVIRDFEQEFLARVAQIHFEEYDGPDVEVIYTFTFYPDPHHRAHAKPLPPPVLAEPVEAPAPPAEPEAAKEPEAAPEEAPAAPPAEEPAVPPAQEPAAPPPSSTEEGAAAGGAVVAPAEKTEEKKEEKPAEPPAATEPAPEQPPASEPQAAPQEPAPVAPAPVEEKKEEEKPAESAAPEPLPSENFSEEGDPVNPGGWTDGAPPAPPAETPAE
ncbi:MAG: hypothetical protein AB1405_12675 [Bdellovibrionota bacterium]